MLQSFSRKSKTFLTDFHREVEARSMKQGTAVAALAMLSQQLRNYEAIFVALGQQLTELMNNLQRDANREFTPVIAKHLAFSYDWQANESGESLCE